MNKYPLPKGVKEGKDGKFRFKGKEVKYLNPLEMWMFEENGRLIEFV